MATVSPTLKGYCKSYDMGILRGFLGIILRAFLELSFERS